MGLTISHGTFDRSYSTFHAFRKMVARTAGFPPLELMSGFYINDGSVSSNPFSGIQFSPDKDAWYFRPILDIQKQLPISWGQFGNKPLIEFLSHSDCDGFINYGMAGRLANELEKLMPELHEEDKGWIEIMEQFIDGCRLAHSKKERLIFR